MEERKELKIFTDNDDEIIEIAMHNSYLIITGKSTFGELIQAQENVWLPFSPSAWNVDEETLRNSIKSVLDYYEDKEAYELCKDLYNVLSDKKKIKLLVKPKIKKS